MNTWFVKGVPNYIDIPIKQPLNSNDTFELRLDTRDKLGILIGGNNFVSFLGTTREGRIKFNSTVEIERAKYIRIFSYSGSKIGVIEVSLMNISE